MFKHASRFAQAMRDKAPRKQRTKRNPPGSKARKLRRARMTDAAWFAYLDACKASGRQPDAVPQAVFDAWKAQQ